MKTMKLILFICINIASWCVCGTVNACTPWHYISCLPEHYRTFRISDWGSNTPWSDCFKNEDTYKLNCELWQKQTSHDIPLEDIYEVVINASLGHMKWLQEDIEKDSLTCFVNNQFAKWLFHKQDMDILRFMILAKKCEKSNGQDTWCYDKDDESNIQLESLYRLALQAADDSRARGRDFLHDRYVLQAMRALFRVGKHKECTELWHKKRVIMQRNVIYNMTGSLAAGAYFRMGKNSTAVKLFMECDNMNEAMFCMSHAMPQDVVGRMEFCLVNSDENMGNFLMISTSVDLVRIAYNRIVYISADGNYSNIVQANGETVLVTFQLGQIEKMIANQIGRESNVFIRIGKSLIVNRDFINYIHVTKQQLVLSDSLMVKHSVSASRDALKQLKEVIENELK